MPNKIPIVSAIAKYSSVGPPKINIDTTIIRVLPCVITVRLIVLVMAWSITCIVSSLRYLRNDSRIRSKMTTDSFTE